MRRVAVVTAFAATLAAELANQPPAPGPPEEEKPASRPEESEIAPESRQVRRARERQQVHKEINLRDDLRMPRDLYFGQPERQHPYGARALRSQERGKRR